MNECLYNITKFYKYFLGWKFVLFRKTLKINLFVLIERYKYMISFFFIYKFNYNFEKKNKQYCTEYLNKLY